jgi:hypothetical protein
MAGPWAFKGYRGSSGARAPLPPISSSSPNTPSAPGAWPGPPCNLKCSMLGECSIVGQAVPLASIATPLLLPPLPGAPPAGAMPVTAAAGCAAAGVAAAATLASPNVKNWCIDTKTMLTPRAKFTVSGCEKAAQLRTAVKMVAMVEEYFFRMVSANL